MQTQQELQFPPGFLWGTASSSHQVEGFNTNNQWWSFEQQPGAIWNGGKSGAACDWWRNAERDFDLMQQYNLQTHRLSIEWSRVEPEPGRFDHKALDRYRELLNGLHRRGMRPMVALHHFTNPLWLERAGGWARPEVIARFQHYVRYTVSALGDLCDLWLTINEPLVYLAQGWLRGYWPPQKTDVVAALRVYRHLLLAHAAGYQAIHAVQPHANVGVASAVRVFFPSDPNSPLDRFAAWLKRHVGEDIWLDGMQDGIVRPPLGLNEYQRALVRSADFIGINYYSRDFVRFTPDPRRFFGREHYAEGGEYSDSGMRGVYSQLAPDGLYAILRRVAKYGLPIYVTENGLPDHDDDQRPRWLLLFLQQVQRAIQDGSDVRGYYHWTFTDNFEWSEGWGLRFGLVELDPATQERRPRRSAAMFGTIARENAIRRATVEEYAPEVAAQLFGE